MIEYVYIIECAGYFKIGRAKNVKRRLKQLQTGSPDDMVVLREYATEHAPKLEAYLHQRLFKRNVRGEWFAPLTVDLADQIVQDFSNDVLAYDPFAQLTERQREALRQQKERQDKDRSVRRILETTKTLAYAKYLLLASELLAYALNHPMLAEYGISSNDLRNVKPHHRDRNYV
jgi:hypothetical protein